MSNKKFLLVALAICRRYNRRMKLTLIISTTIFGIAGAYIPYLWGDTGFFSAASIIFSTIGGIFGIFVGWWVYKRFDF